MLREVCNLSTVLSFASVPLYTEVGVMAPACADFSLVLSSSSSSFSYHFTSGAFPSKLDLNK